MNIANIRAHSDRARTWQLKPNKQNSTSKMVKKQTKKTLWEIRSQRAPLCCCYSHTRISLLIDANTSIQAQIVTTMTNQTLGYSVWKPIKTIVIAICGDKETSRLFSFHITEKHFCWNTIAECETDSSRHRYEQKQRIYRIHGLSCYFRKDAF